MPICSICNIGLPPEFTECPECGRDVVQVIVDDLEIEDVVGDEWPADPEPDEAPEPQVEGPPEEIEPYETPIAIELSTSSPEAEEPEAVEEIEEFEQPVEPEESAEPEEPEEPEAELEEAETLIVEDEPALEPEAVRDEPLAEEQPEQPEQPDESEGSEEPRRQEDADVDDLEDEFLTSGRGFRSIERMVEQPAVRDVPIVRGRPVRWAHRAYRGEFDVVSAKGSRTVTTLVVFGDGLLLVPGGAHAAGLLAEASGGIVPPLTGNSSSRKRFKLLSHAASSAEGEARMTGARRLAASEIQSVVIESGHGWGRALTIRSVGENVYSYRFPSRRHARVVGLLRPILGGKLREVAPREKGPV